MLLPAVHMDDHKLVVPCFLPYENSRKSSWSWPLSLQAKLPDHLSLKVRRIMLGHYGKTAVMVLPNAFFEAFLEGFD
jgi:hypothetical protein